MTNHGKVMRAFGTIAALLTSTAITHVAMAQSLDVAESASAAESDVITVTAQRRSESLQDVPVSISAIGGDALDRARIGSVDDLATRIPNLNVTSTVGEGTPIFSLRGVSMSDFSLNQSGPVATYYDEVYKGNFALLGVALYDLERVEVLRGPQGTLYGRNTTGGAVNLISRRPELGSLEGYGRIGVGNYDRMEASAAINLPLGEDAALRVASQFTRADGWFKNRLPGKPDLNETREYAVRASLLWEPSDSASFLLRASTSLQNPYNYGVFAPEGPDGNGAGIYEDFGDGTSYFRPDDFADNEGEFNYTPRRHARTYALSLATDISVSDALSLISITSWDKGVLEFGEDTSGSPNQTLEIFYGGRANQFTEDLRLSSDFGGPFEFILGAYYSREDVYNTTTLGFFRDLDVDGDGSVDADDCGAGLPYGCNLTNSFDQLKKSYALYTDFSFDLNELITLRGGLRFTRDQGAQTNLQAAAFGADGVLAVPLIDPAVSRRYEDDIVSGKIGVDFNVDRDLMFYATFSRGYRGRSFNAQAFFDPSEATISEPERLDAFELGVKSQFADRRVTLNGAAFYYRYKDQQFINVNPLTLVQTLVNVDRSRIYGGEFELSIRVNDAIDFRSGVGIVNAKVEQGALSGVDISGNTLISAPEITANAGLDIILLDSEAGTFSIHPDVSYVSSQFFDVFNTPYLEQSGYALIGGHVDFERGPLSVSIWAKNLADKSYTTSRVDSLAGFGFVYNHLGTPRTFGISVGYDF